MSTCLLCSCASQESVNKEIEKLKQGPQQKPYRTITNFSGGLRCMDNLMLDYGVRDISMLVEDLSDETTKVNAGTKDILITAISHMTRRSRAIKLIPYGNDSGNLIAFLANAGSKSIFNAVPQYDIRGSISQLDRNVAKKQSGGSLAIDELSLGGSASTAGTILGIDLSVLSTNDLSVIPGVTSSNAVVLFKSGKGLDTDARIDKTGVSFGFQVAKNDATIQALRNLIELASIELVGRLIKLPYWTCLDIPADTPEIAQEVEDWYYAMVAHGEITPYVRKQMITRGYYPTNEARESFALKTAVLRFQKSAGVTPTGTLDYSLFRLLLGEPQQRYKPTSLAKIDKSNEQKSKVRSITNTPEKSSRPNLELKRNNASTPLSPGARLDLKIVSDKPAYVFCYLQDANGNIQRFFPNRFESNNLVTSTSAIELPGNMPFDITVSDTGLLEQIACYATQNNVFNKLPTQLQLGDFENLQLNALDSLSEAYNTASDGKYAKAEFTIQAK